MTKHKRILLLGTLLLPAFITCLRGDDGKAPGNPPAPPPAKDNAAKDAPAAEDSRSWYLRDNKPGVPANDIRPPSIPKHVRQAFRASTIAATTSNSWIVWVSAWPRNGGKDGRVYVDEMSMEAIVPINTSIPICTQRYEAGGEVWGGWFRFDDRLWYKMGMRDANNFSIGEYRDGGQPKFTGAIIDVGEHADPPAAGHIWMMRWPRDEAPPHTERLRLRARFAVTGSAFVNVGMDRYRLCDADPEPQQEVLVSDTYGSEHCKNGPIEVVMETSVITWQPP